MENKAWNTFETFVLHKLADEDSITEYNSYKISEYSGRTEVAAPSIAMLWGHLVEAAAATLQQISSPKRHICLTEQVKRKTDLTNNCIQYFRWSFEVL